MTCSVSFVESSIIEEFKLTDVLVCVVIEEDGGACRALEVDAILLLIYDFCNFDLHRALLSALLCPFGLIFFREWGLLLHVHCHFPVLL